MCQASRPDGDTSDVPRLGTSLRVGGDGSFAETTGNGPIRPRCRSGQPRPFVAIVNTQIFP
jgi:hypothetical protein